MPVAHGACHSRAGNRRAAISQRDNLLFVVGVQAELQAAFLADGITTEWWALALDRLVMLSQSAFGFIARLEHDDTGDPLLRSLAVSDPGQTPWFMSYLEGRDATNLVFRNPNSLFGVTMSTGEIVISDDPSGDPRRGGLPPGHPPLHSYAGLPLHDGETLVGMVGLANRPEGFTPAIMDDLAPLTMFISQIIARDLANSRAVDAAREATRLGAQASGLIEGARHSDLLREANTSILAAPDSAAAAHVAVAAMMGLDPAAVMDVYVPGEDPAVVTAIAGGAVSAGPLTIPRRCCMALTEGGVHVSGLGAPEASCEHARHGQVTVCAPVAAPASPPGLVLVRAPLPSAAAGSAVAFAFLTAAAEQLAASLTEAAQRADLARSARTDHLTGLANRMAFLQALEAELSRLQRGGRHMIGLLLIDIDDFKSVNDTFGHDAGDAALRSVATALHGALREGDVLARLGGDEFIVLMAPTDKAALERTASRIVEAREAVSDPSGRPVSVSAGGVLLGSGAVTWEAAYAAVDAALYRAKAAGRGGFVMSPMIGHPPGGWAVVG